MESEVYSWAASNARDAVVINNLCISGRNWMCVKAHLDLSAAMLSGETADSNLVPTTGEQETCVKTKKFNRYCDFERLD